MRNLLLLPLAVAAAAPAHAASFDLIAGMASGGSEVRAYRTPGLSPVLDFNAFAAGAAAGVSVAAGDVDGDGIADIVAGAGGGSRVRIFSGATGVPIRDFAAFGPGFDRGVRVALGDVSGDGVADVVVGAGAGGTPEVRVFDGASGALIADFTAFEPGFAGGVRVTASDVNGDGRADIIVGAGSGDTQVRIFDGRTLQSLGSIAPFGRAANGVTLATGRYSGFDALFVGSGGGTAPLVGIYRLSDLSLVNSLLAFDATFMGGVSVAGGSYGGGDALFAATLSGSGELAAFATGSRVPVVQGRFQPFGAGYTGGITLAAVAAVPEPAAWTMMTLGFGAIGAALRRRLSRRSGVRTKNVPLDKTNRIGYTPAPQQRP